MSLLNTLKHYLHDTLDFQSRVWVVSVVKGPSKGESFIVNEDDFSSPLQWMVIKGYTADMLASVDRLNNSQVAEFDLGKFSHCVLRVK